MPSISISLISGDISVGLTALLRRRTNITDVVILSKSVLSISIEIHLCLWSLKLSFRCFAPSRDQGGAGGAGWPYRRTSESFRGTLRENKAVHVFFLPVATRFNKQDPVCKNQVLKCN